jgi:uncharacterized protein YndB with AHSA1/START domain
VQLNAEIRYDAPPAVVFDMLTDQAFQERKLAQTGALTYSASVVVSGDGGAVVASSRALPTDRVPDAFRTLVGDRLTVEQTETWEPPRPDGSRRGTLAVSVAGAPVKMSATLSLTPSPAGSVEVVSGDLKARVPLVGGRIEKAVEPAVRAAIDAEERIGRTWLAEQH